MKIKKLPIITAIIMLISMFSSIPVSAVTFNPGISTASKAVYMVNLDRDLVVYEKNSDKKMYPASLTKIMTAIVVLDNVMDLENTVFEAPLEVFDDLYMTGALTIGFGRGEQITVKDLMYSMLVYSACESAGILAYNVGGGSMDNFVDMMNEKAKEIGCTGTQFANPHGLHDRDQYTNAEDMAKITRYALDNYPEFEEIACTYEYVLGATNYSEEGWIRITHSSKLMNPASEYYYPYAKGIKTGTTDESGRNLISLAEKDGNRYLLVTMDAPMYDDNGYNDFGNFEDHIALYNWAFDTLSYQQIVPENKEITEIPVIMGSDKDYVRLVTKESHSMLWSNQIDVDKLKETIDTSAFTDENGAVAAPIEQGQTLGTYTLSLNGEIICSVDLVAQESISLSIWEYNLSKAKQFFGSVWFKIGLVIALVLIVIYGLICIRINNIRRHRMERKRRNRRR